VSLAEQGIPVTPRRGLLAALLLAVVAFTGCARTASTTTPSAAPPLVLAATLTSPTDVTLSWRDAGPAPAGRVVEYATDPAGPYTVLAFLPPGRTTYRHQKLMPGTEFLYRVVPYYGPASAPVEVDLPPGAYDSQPHPDDQSWAKPEALPVHPPVALTSIRGTAAAPTGLAGKVMDANGIRFTWTDHDRDGQGYLMEVRPSGGADFQVVQVLDPRVDSCGVATLPDEKTASYRVRAFYYGEPSNTVRETTGS
jgi:hypothetical protein